MDWNKIRKAWMSVKNEGLDKGSMRLWSLLKSINELRRIKDEL